MRILIVEDEQMLADSIATMLKSRGFEADAVYDGQSGFESAMSGSYDLMKEHGPDPDADSPIFA